MVVSLCEKFSSRFHYRSLCFLGCRFWIWYYPTNFHGAFWNTRKKGDFRTFFVFSIIISKVSVVPKRSCSAVEVNLLFQKIVCTSSIVRWTAPEIRHLKSNFFQKKSFLVLGQILSRIFGKKLSIWRKHLNHSPPTEV